MTGPAEGPLTEGEARRLRPRTDFTVGDLVVMGRRTLFSYPGRVVWPAVAVFGLTAAAETVASLLQADGRLPVTERVAIVVLTMVATIGLTFYAGLLDRLVGAVEEGREPPPVGQVLRTLPYGRLVVADVALLVIGAVTSAVLVLPGLVAFTLFAIVGPLINMEDHGVVSAFTTSARLLWPNFWKTLVAVTLPVAIEHELVNVVELFWHEKSVVVVYVLVAFLNIVFGTCVGLVEVALAEHVVHGAPVHLLEPPD